MNCIRVTNSKFFLVDQIRYVLQKYLGVHIFCLYMTFLRTIAALLSNVCPALICENITFLFQKHSMAKIAKMWLCAFFLSKKGLLQKTFFLNWVCVWVYCQVEMLEILCNIRAPFFSYHGADHREIVGTWGWCVLKIAPIIWKIIKFVSFVWYYLKIDYFYHSYIILRSIKNGKNNQYTVCGFFPLCAIVFFPHCGSTVKSLFS